MHIVNTTLIWCISHTHLCIIMCTTSVHTYVHVILPSPLHHTIIGADHCIFVEDWCIYNLHFDISIITESVPKTCLFPHEYNL